MCGLWVRVTHPKLNLNCIPPAPRRHNNLRHGFETVLLYGPVQCRGPILGPVVQDGAPIHQGNEQFIWLLHSHRNRQRRLVRLLAMEVRIQPLRAHLRDLLDLPVVHVLDESPQVGARVQRL